MKSTLWIFFSAHTWIIVWWLALKNSVRYQNADFGFKKNADSWFKKNADQLKKMRTRFKKNADLLKKMRTRFKKNADQLKIMRTVLKIMRTLTV